MYGYDGLTTSRRLHVELEVVVDIEEKLIKLRFWIRWDSLSSC
jgi:hypothetical protein